MPLTKKDEEVKRSFEKRYKGRGKEVFYRTLNKRISEGKTPNLPEAKRMAAKRRHNKGRAKKSAHRR